MTTRDPAKIKAQALRKQEWSRTPRFLPPALRRAREKLANRAVTVLKKLGVKEVHREAFGLRGGTNEQTWFVTLVDLHRYLVIVRDEHNQRMVLARKTPDEVQRTIHNLGFAEDGWPIDEHAEVVIDLVEETCTRVRLAEN